MTGATGIGVACGLGAAVLQSVAYVASRHFTRSRPHDGRAGLTLLVLMHLWLGGMAAVTLPFVWTAGVDWHRVLPPLALAATLDLLGQAGLTVALRHAEPSRVSPLLTAKVFVPALLGTVLGQPVGPTAYRYLTGWQWLAVVLCVVAGVSVNRAGGRLRRTAAAAIVFTVAVFAGSDWFIGLTVGGILATPGVSPLGASLLAVSVLYLLTAAVALAALPTRWGGSGPDRLAYPWPAWRDALPYAACWYAAMVVLFVAFGEVGVVLGTILQCTRSFLTIALGVALMYLGYAHIEPPQPPRVVVQRVAAGVLMSLAITLYIVRDPVAALAKRRPGPRPAPVATVTAPPDHGPDAARRR